MNNLGVVGAFFEGIREVLDGSGHTDDMGLDGDHVGIPVVDGDSASGNAVYSSSGKLFISKFCVHISTSIQLNIFAST